MLFGRTLRSLGLPVTSSRLIEVANSLGYIDIGSREDFKNTLRCILVSRLEELDTFDRAFDRFWVPRMLDWQTDPIDVRTRGLPPPADNAGRDARVQGMKKQGRSVLGAEAVDEPGEDEMSLPLYSPGEALRQKDFSAFDQKELADARRFLAEMRWAMTRRRSLRPRSARTGARLDVRRSVRRSLRYGGELLDLAYRGPKLKRRQLVLLCDISGSMDRYTRMLLHFLHSVERGAGRVETFVFGTRLTRITRALRLRSADSALAAVSSEVQDWSGGTRIGESLRAFNRHWARRVLGHGAIVIVISDGWDRGDPEVLATEMERLQRASYRLIWLNPLLGSGSYQPLTQGILAALPYVDDFLPVHNLASLNALAELLNEIQEIRPSRRQNGRRSSSL